MGNERRQEKKCSQDGIFPPILQEATLWIMPHTKIR